MDRSCIAHAMELAGWGLGPATEILIDGEDPFFDTPFRLGEGAAVALAMVGQAANGLWMLRGEPGQQLTVSARHAAASLVSFSFLSLEGEVVPPYEPPVMTDIFPCRDGRRIHLHASFDAGRAVLAYLGLPAGATRAAIAAATSARDAFALEESLARRGLCGVVVRTAQEWASSPQGRWLTGKPALEIVRIGDAAPEPLPAGRRPLSGIRVLDLTRVLAGPTCARTLAEHGADVLHLAAPKLPTFERFEMDTGHGKRQAWLDLDDASQFAILLELARDGDVFSQGFRPGAFTRRGLGPEALAALRPGIVYVSENCYGHGGPWGERPGWEQLAQAATGIATAQGTDAPSLVPAAFNDYTTGYLAAAGTMEALRRRAVEGGSWHVRVSLCQTSQWFQALGRVPDGRPAQGLGDTAALLQQRATPYGPMRFLAPPLRMSRTMPYWELPSAPPGSGGAAWAVR